MHSVGDDLGKNMGTRSTNSLCADDGWFLLANHGWGAVRRHTETNVLQWTHDSDFRAAGAMLLFFFF